LLQCRSWGHRGVEELTLLGLWDSIVSIDSTGHFKGFEVVGPFFDGDIVSPKVVLAGGRVVIGGTDGAIGVAISAGHLDQRGI
jgi:hypothetical protein